MNNTNTSNTEKKTLEEILKESLTSMKLSKKAFKGVDIDINTVSSIKKMVSFYYMIQDNRVRVSNQKYALDQEEDGGNDIFMAFFKDQMCQTENNIATFLDVWTNRNPIGKWAKSNTGIGPVIAAGLVARFDVKKTQTAGGFWAYAGIAKGMDERAERKRGEVAKYSPETKVHVWKASSSFKMQSTRDNCYYGKLYREKKAEYLARNDDGGFRKNAEYELSVKKIGTDTDAYKAYIEGKLPLAHIDAMAMRYAGKIFISHLFDVMYMYEYGEMPPVPYPIAYINGHTHILHPQNLEVILPYLKVKFPDKDWKSMINNHYKRELI